MQVDSNEPIWVVKVGKNLKNDLVEPFVEFLKKNLDVFSWTYADMVRIHPDVMCHRLNINPQVKPVRQKRRALDANRYKALQEKVGHLLKISSSKNPSILTGYPILF